MDGNRPEAMSDDALDRALDAAFTVDPSPEFLARVRTRIAAAAAPRRTAWLAPWMPWAAAAGLVLLAVSTGLWQVRSDQSPAAPLAAAPAPLMPSASGESVQGSRAVESPSRAPELQTPARPVRQTRTTRERAASSPVRSAVASAVTPAVGGPPFAEVLVPPERLRAFERLVEAVERGRAPALAPDLDPENPFGIEPIAVEPLTLTDLSIGPPVEGEDRP